MPKEPLPETMIVRFRDGTFTRIERLAGKNRRAEFIRKAVEGLLAAREPKPPPRRERQSGKKKEP